MRFFYRFASVKILGPALFIIIALCQETNCMQALSRSPFVRKAEELALQASEAAKKGNLTTSKQILNQIDSLTRHQLIKAVIQNSPTVQEAKRNHTEAEQDAINAEAKKSEEDKRAKEQAIAERIAFEKESAQKRISQMEEDKKRATLKEHQQKNQPQIPQPIQETPQTQTHQEGKSFISSLMGGVIEAAKSTDPHIVPGFQTDKPKESSLDVGSIGDAALAESRTNEISQHLASQAQKRQSFKIDPNTDPLFVEANQITKNPQKAINEEVREVSASEGGIKEEIKTCEEGGDEYQQSCSKQLKVTLKITPQQGYTTPRSCIGHWESAFWGTKWYCDGCRGGDYVITQHRKVEATDKWINGCIVLEDLVDKGLCRYVGASRSAQNETRTIQGEPVTRDHFEEHYQFACSKAPTTQVSPNSCAGLREQGCYQIDSKCKEGDGNYCFLWEQTYLCPSDKKVGKSYRSSNAENPFCLTGNCADTSYEANNELLNVMSHLSVLREAQNDLKNFAVIFKGQQRACTRNLWDFRDCCGSGKGWGVTLHLSSCDAAEVELRTLRDKKLCIQVGTYCAERHLGQCTRKKTTFCCYGTKLARLIQENGHAQLGMEFGSPEHPNCEGLSPEQLSRIDFSRINFSEIFEEIKNQTIAKDQEQSLAQVSADRLQNNMTLLTKPPLDQGSTEARQKLKEKGL